VARTQGLKRTGARLKSANAGAIPTIGRANAVEAQNASVF
jgi:hypothetical protein